MSASEKGLEREEEEQEDEGLNEKRARVVARHLQRVSLVQLPVSASPCVTSARVLALYLQRVPLQRAASRAPSASACYLYCSF